MVTLAIETPIGAVILTESEGFIVEIKVEDTMSIDLPNESNNTVLSNAAAQLQEYFAGQRRQFTFPVKQTGSVFQQGVWQQLMQTGFGETSTYAQLSKQMNNPLAIRAIASANGKNKLWIVVPCHRIIGSDGSLTGYAGGLWRKQWLLDHEAKICGKGQMQISF